MHCLLTPAVCCLLYSREGRHHFCLAGEEAEMGNVNERQRERAAR